MSEYIENNKTMEAEERNTSSNLATGLKLKCIYNMSQQLTLMRSEQTDTHGYSMETAMAELFKELKDFDDEIEFLTRFYKENMAYVKIYFKSMAIQHTIQSRTYDFWSFLCDTGGTLGLFLGASLLTLFECVELLFMRSLDAMGLSPAKKTAPPPPTTNGQPSPAIVLTTGTPKESRSTP